MRFPAYETHGRDKFKTPRTQDERVPIFVLPECVSRAPPRLATIVSHLDIRRCRTLSQSSHLDDFHSRNRKKDVPAHSHFNDDVSYEMRIRLSDVYSVIDKNGMPAHRRTRLCEGRFSGVLIYRV